MALKTVDTSITGYSRKSASGKTVAVKKYSRLQKKTTDLATGKEKGVSPHIKGATPVKGTSTSNPTPQTNLPAVPLDHLRTVFPTQVAKAEALKAKLEKKISEKLKNYSHGKNSKG